MKKALSLVLSFIFVFLIFAASVPVAFAANYSGQCGSGVTWSLDTFTGTLTIEGSGTMNDYSADVLPGWSAYQSYIKTVTFAEGVKSVGDYAFYNLSGYKYLKLTALNFSSTVSVVGEYAFRGCKNIENITSLNAGEIQDYAFRSCTGLNSIDLGSALLSIGNGAFSLCSNLSEISFPSTLKIIENAAFEGCSGLTDLSIPSNVTSIGDNAFAKCTALKNVIYSASSITDCENGIFFGSGASDGMSVTFSDNITTVPADIFNNCINLTEVTLSDSVTTIGDNSFNGSGIKAIYLPKSVKTISNSAFTACNSLEAFAVNSSNTTYCAGENGELLNRSKNIIYRYPSGRAVSDYTLLSSVVVIQKGAFSGDTHLQSVNTNNATSLNSDAFEQCRELTDVNMPKVTSVKTYGFADCDKLVTVTAPSVTSIESCGFFGCDALTNLDGFTSLKTIGDYAFAGCNSIVNLTLPSTVTTIGSYAFTNNDSMVTLELPSSVTTLKDNAFASNDELTTLTLNEGLVSVGKNAFVNCSKLKSVKIPKSVTTISSYAFGYTMTASLKYTAVSGFTVYYYSGSTGGTYASNNASLGSEVVTDGQEEIIPGENGSADFVPVTELEMPTMVSLLKSIVSFIINIIKAVV